MHCDPTKERALLRSILLQPSHAQPANHSHLWCEPQSLQRRRFRQTSPTTSSASYPRAMASMRTRYPWQGLHFTQLLSHPSNRAIIPRSFPSFTIKVHPTRHTSEQERDASLVSPQEKVWWNSDNNRSKVRQLRAGDALTHKGPSRCVTHTLASTASRRSTYSDSSRRLALHSMRRETELLSGQITWTANRRNLGAKTHGKSKGVFTLLKPPRPNRHNTISDLFATNRAHRSPSIAR